MITIEERVQRIVEANWRDKEALIYGLAREMHQLRAALPSAADLESIAYHMESAGGQDVFFADGTICNASLMLRRSAALIRLAINELTEPERATGSTPPL